MSGYTKLFSSITASTIWQAPDAHRLVWITMLAIADQHGYVGASVPGLASLARVSMDDCIKALESFLGPDKWSRTQDYEGRRITVADGGWILLNHKKYREIRDADERREQSRVAMAKMRAKRKDEESDVNNVIKVIKVNQGDPKFAQAEASSSPEAEASSKASERSTPVDDHGIFNPPTEAPTSEHQWSYEKSSPYVKPLLKAAAKIGSKNWQAWKTLVDEFTIERVASAVKALPADERWPDKTEISLRAQGSQKPIGEVVQSKIRKITQ